MGTDSILERLSESVAAYANPTPEFPLTVDWAHGYDALFSGRFQQVAAEIESIAERALESGRVLLSGRGGSGKTTVLRRVADRAQSRGIQSVWTNFSRWTHSDYEAWNALTSHSERISYLLSKHSSPTLTISELDKQRTFVFVDGINELVSRTGQEIISAIDVQLQFAPKTSFIVSDRLTRRELRRPDKWHLGSVHPLEKADIAKHTAEQGDYFSLPFFLDALIHGRGIDVAAYWNQHCGLSKPETEVASRAAYKLYEVSRARAFDIEELRRIAGNEITANLVACGAITGDGRATFTHHLLHDFLAAQHFAHGEDLWCEKGFDVITLDASSFDVLVLVASNLKADALEHVS